MMNYVISTFYHFLDFPDFREKQPILEKLCEKHQIKGTILLAAEGINATIAGSAQGIETILDFLRSDPRLTTLETKESYSDVLPFKRMKVKLKKEIVTFGEAIADPQQQVGIYIEPKQWNNLIQDPEVILVDTRNEYEFEIGSFKGAKNPHTDSFREFPHYVAENLGTEKHKKIALFCTGGIRCEKATSFLLSQGFEEVYHLKGGILKYLEEISETESLWEGECFVFDERVAVKHGLVKGSYDMCKNCGNPISEAEKNSPYYQKDLSCPHCYEKAR
jgi:UPF0176 protein